MQRCPCCNARLKEAVHCPRCKADLQEIIQVQKLAKIWYQKAIACYLNNEVQLCLDALTRSLQLRHSESALLFRAFVLKRQKKTSVLAELQQIAQEVLMLSTKLLKRLKDKLTPRVNPVQHAYKDAKTNKVACQQNELVKR